jgi:hypothetical protein
MRKLLRRLNFLLHRNRLEAELAEEMEFHRDLLARDHSGDRSAATRAMGNVTLAREDARGIWLLPWIESLWQDLAYGIRGLRRQPGFTLVAVSALSIAIGLNTSLFTLFNAVAFRPWPVKEPARVVNLGRLMRKGPEQGHTAGFGVAEWRYLSEHSKAFLGFVLAGGGERVDLDGRALKLRWVSGNYFSVLGLDMARGRGFRPARPADRRDPQLHGVAEPLWRCVRYRRPHRAPGRYPVHRGRRGTRRIHRHRRFSGLLGAVRLAPDAAAARCRLPGVPHQA